MASFKALRIDKVDGEPKAQLASFDESEWAEGDVIVAVQWSALNYKDGLAITGKAPVVRRFPMVAGVDLAGTVIESQSARWKPGDKVILNGWGLGETHPGAFAERARVKSEWLLRLPPGMSAREAMAIGTAGFTAMLAVMALENHGLRPDAGPVVVTGAAGGVGSVAIALLAKAGFRVTAATGRDSEAGYLRNLGAAEVIARASLTGPVKPLAKETFAGGIDVVGSTVLANILSMIKYGGAVAACGLTAGVDLPTTVAPFILRGVCLLGIDSVMCPLDRREAAWTRLDRDLDRDKLLEITREISLDEVMTEAPRILAGEVRGRTVVKIG